MRAKKECEILNAFIAGKIKTQDELDEQLAKLRSGLGFLGVKLKKIKVTTKITRISLSPTSNQGVSIKEL